MGARVLINETRYKPLKTLERVKGIEPSSSAWKIVDKLNDFNEPCVKWQAKNRPKLPIFATGNETVRSATNRFGASVVSSQEWFESDHWNRRPELVRWANSGCVAAMFRSHVGAFNCRCLLREFCVHASTPIPLTTKIAILSKFG